MSTMVRSIEEAQRLAAHMAGVRFEETVFTEAPDLKVMDAGTAMLDPTSETGKAACERAMTGQKGYRFKNCEGVEVGVVVAPFREGFCVWAVTPSGVCLRF